MTRELTDDEIRGDYEANTGCVIAERFRSAGLLPADVPACLDVFHGPFTWGSTVEEALDTAIALEAVAATALHTLALSGAARPFPPALLERHFTRKHGPGAYYGQPAEPNEQQRR